MIPRRLSTELVTQLTEFPSVTILGPRQAGKTTLARLTLPDFDYVTLENPEALALANEDPQGFLESYGKQTIFAEIQRAPHLLSYLQGIVDEGGGNGQFVLTGSHQLELRQAVSQSLAGRTGMLFLLPLSIQELVDADMALGTFEEYLLHGFLPRVHAQKQRPRVAYASYYQTYVERDVRQLIKLKDNSLFEKFVKLLAGRVGQLINYQSLGNDVGIDAKTVRHWLSILEASFVIFKLPAHFANFGKRVIKSPKYYFTDTGLLCYLLGLEEPAQVTRDPLVGNLFENLVILEARKALLNQGRTPSLSFFRDSHGNEIDLLFESGRELTGIEIKSSSTYHTSFKKGLDLFHKNVKSLARRFIIYNGDNHPFSDGSAALPYNQTSKLFSSTLD